MNATNGCEEDIPWLPDNEKNCLNENVQIKLLCGADLLESFATEGLWSTEDVWKYNKLIKNLNYRIYFVD